MPFVVTKIGPKSATAGLTKIGPDLLQSESGSTPVDPATRNLFVGSSEVTDVRIGSTQINEVYVGSTLMWSRT